VPTYADAAHHPLITKCTKRGLDVIVLTDPIDEYVTQMLTTYKEHTLVNIAGSDIPLPPHTDDETSKKETEQQEADHKHFLDYVTTMIGPDMIEKTSF
jgi:HSP90 family molecular chaperone